MQGAYAFGEKGEVLSSPFFFSGTQVCARACVYARACVSARAWVRTVGAEHLAEIVTAACDDTCQVVEGNGRIVVLAVGPLSTGGKISKLLQDAQVRAALACAHMHTHPCTNTPTRAHALPSTQTHAHPRTQAHT